MNTQINFQDKNSTTLYNFGKILLKRREINKDENVHIYAVRGEKIEKERERERKRVREIEQIIEKRKEYDTQIRYSVRDSSTIFLCGNNGIIMLWIRPTRITGYRTHSHHLVYHHVKVNDL